jgi:hypothetical protein
VLAPNFAPYVVRIRGAYRHNGAVIVAETFQCYLPDPGPCGQRTRNQTMRRRGLLGAGVLLCAAPAALLCRAESGTVRERRPVAGVERVVWNAAGEFDIRQGAGERLEIEAEPRALRMVVARVVDGTLELGVASGGFSTDRPVRWRLVIQRLAALSVAGSGSVTVGPLRTSDIVLRAGGSGNLDFQNPAARSLQVDASGSMDIRIAAGRGETQRVVLSGSGDYQASGLMSLDAEVSSRGSGSAAVHAERSLRAHRGQRRHRLWRASRRPLHDPRQRIAQPALMQIP